MTRRPTPHEGEEISAVDRVDEVRLPESVDASFLEFFAARASDGLVVVDESDTIVYANAALRDRLGHRPDELVGESLTVLFPERLVDRHDQPLAAGLEPEGGYCDQGGVEVPGRHRHGYEVPLSVAFHEVDAEDGRFWAGILRGGGDRSAHEHDLEQYAAALDAVGDAVYRLDADGRFVAVNDVVTAVTGYSRDELLGEHVSTVVDEGTIARHVDAIRDLHDDDDRTVATVELDVQTADGRTMPCENRITLVRSGGEFAGTVGVIRDITAQKERQRQIRESERRLATLMGNLPGVVYRSSTAPGGPMEFASEGCRALTGYSSEELESGTVDWWEGIAHPDDQDSVSEAAASGIEEDGEFEVTYRIVTADGDVKWVWERGQAVYDDGELAAVEGYVIDVTQRHEAREALRRERERYRVTLSSLSETVLVTDDRGEFTYVNPAVNSIFDYTADEVRELGSVQELFGGDLIDAAELHEAGVISNVEHTVTDKHGDEHHLLVSAKSVSIGDGTILYTCRDVTDRMAAEEALRSERVLLDHVLQTSPVGITVSDSSSEMLRINERAADILGLPKDEIVGRSINGPEWTICDADGEPIPPEDRPFERVLETGEPVYDWENVIEMPDGDWTWLLVNAAPIFGADGEIERVVESIDDITARKETEERLRRERDLNEQILETTPVSILAVDRDGRCVRANSRAEKRLGMAERDDRYTVGDRDIYDETGEWIPPEERPYMRVFETGEPVADWQCQIDHGERGRRWLSVYAAPLSTAHDEVEQVLIVAKDITELKQRELELTRRQSELESELDEILGRISDAFFALDDEWRFTYVNERAEELLEVGRAQLLGENLWDTYPETIGTAFQDEYERAMAEQVAVEFEAYYPPFETWFEVWAYPSESGLSVYFRDVTERRERERALEESEQRYRTLAEQFPNGAVALIDRDLRYTLIEGQLPAKVDLDTDEIIGRPVGEVHPPAAAEAFERNYRAALDGESTSFETSYGDRHLQVWTVPIHDESGEVFAGMGMSQDVTERKERERALEQYQAITQAASDAIITIDEESVVQAVNPAVADIFGYEPDELIGESLATLMSDELAARHVERLDQYLRTDERHLDWDYVELPGRHKDGHEIPLAISFSAGEYGGERFFTGIIRDNTDRKRREHELEQYERIVETIDEGVYVVDPDGYITMANRAYAEMTGYPREEVIGSHVSRFVDDDVSRKANELERQILSDERDTAILEAELRTRDGEPIVVEATFALLPNEGPGYERIGVVRDITERKRFEETLRALHESTRDLFRAETYQDIHDGMVDTAWDVLDLSGVAIYFRDEDDGLLHPRAESVNLEFVRDNLPTVAPDESSIVGHVYATGESRLVDDIRESPYRRLDPEETDMRSGIFVPIGDRGVLVAGSTTVGALDVRTRQLCELLAATADAAYDRVDREAALREHERQLQDRVHQQQAITDLGQYALEEPDLDALFDEAVELVAETLDNDYCKVLDLLPGGDELLLRSGVGWNEGYVGEATVGTEYSSQAGFTLLSDDPIVVEDLATETRFSGPDLLVDHDVRGGLSTIIGPHDSPWGVLGTHDTERGEFGPHDVNFVQTVASILASAIDRDRHRCRLEETIGKLEQSNAKLEQFAYVASHDLQEPLRMISSYLQLLERRYGDALDDDAHEFLEYAVDGADRMRQMIDDLLAYSRVDTRGAEFERTDVAAVVERVVDDLGLMIEEHDAEISWDALPTVMADANQLGQLFQNLLANAIKYSRDEPPRVAIGAERRGDAWVLSVADNGIGIAPDQTDRIFEIFTRLHNNDEYSGTGIGLALCRKIVERHGGRIRVESAPGEGSTFYVTLPEGGTDSD